MLSDEVDKGWIEVARILLPSSIANLSDKELETLRQQVEAECVSAFLVLIDG